MKFIGVASLMAVLSLAAQAEESYDAFVSVPGSTVGQQRVYFAAVRLDRFAAGCLSMPKECALEEPALKLLEQIRSNTSKIKRFQDAYAFKSGRENPGFFKVCAGKERLAVTGSKPGDLITFNTDLIDGVSTPEIVAMLIHEHGHHLGIRDEDFRLLDVLGAKVRQHLERRLQALQVEDTGQEHVKVYVHNFTHNRQDPSLPADRVRLEHGKGSFFLPIVWVEDQKRVLDLSWTFMGTPWCPYGDYFVGKLWIHQLALEQSLPWDSRDRRKRLLYRSSVSNACTQISTGKDHYPNHETHLLVALDLRLPAGGAGEWWSAGRAELSPRTGTHIADPGLGSLRSESPVVARDVVSEFSASDATKTWKVKMTVDASALGPLENGAECVAYASSDEIQSRNAFGAPAVVRLKECKKTRTGSKVIFAISHSFARAANRTYYLNRVELFANALASVRSVVPEVRQSIRISGNPNPTPRYLGDRVVSEEPMNQDDVPPGYTAIEYFAPYELQIEATGLRGKAQAFVQHFYRPKDFPKYFNTLEVPDFYRGYASSTDALADGKVRVRLHLKNGDGQILAEAFDFLRISLIDEDFNELVVDFEDRSRGLILFSPYD